MKKLMIVAAVAAMASGAFASPQVYDVKLTVKTTTCKKAKLTKAIADLGWFTGVKQGDEVAFRGTTTRTIGGLIWGCSCEGISRPSWRVETKVGVGGYAFWDQTTAPYKPFQIPYTLFDWAVLNRVGKMTNVEGTWVLGDSAKDEAFFFVGAGFGTVTIGMKNGCDSDSYIKTMSGNFAGFAEYTYTDSDGCIFCGETSSDCLVAPFCFCDGLRVTWDLTACYGTWQLKYNASQSKKLEKKAFITDVRNFTGKNVAALGAALDAGYLATQLAASSLGADVNTNAMVKAAANAKATSTDVTLKKLLTTGKYYVQLESTVKGYANVDKSVLWLEDPGESKVTAAVSVAETIIDSLSHIEAAADKEDSDDDWDDDWDDDDDGGDDWEF